MLEKLPIHDVIHELDAALQQRDEVVLEAPPGAGKTTYVPLALQKAEWLGEQKIIMLEPRRMAARNAALRMASLLNEPVGQTIGYQVRHDRCIGKSTRIIVVTEGILTRWLQSDPSLEDTGLIIFDEFHERNLDSDLGLALSLQARAFFRDTSPLKILVMSATLDAGHIAHFLDHAPLIKSEGKSYPVQQHYAARSCSAKAPIAEPVAESVLDALTLDTGNVLVFLPGKGEIEKVTKQLSTQLASDVLLVQLHGSLNLQQQQDAISPELPANKTRKIVLATDIAETSLTIAGVTVVVDSGLCRKPEYDPRTGMTRLRTQRISLASATQRAGRAGRLSSGHVIRLWPQAEEVSFQKHSEPEIRCADLSGFALQLFQWGVFDPAELRFLDAPAPGAFSQACSLLDLLGAIEVKNDHLALTQHGQQMANIPAHPRLAHLLLLGADLGETRFAANVAAMLTERDPLSVGVSIQARLDSQSTSPSSFSHKLWQQRVKQQAKQFMQAVSRRNSEKTDRKSSTQNVTQKDLLGVLVASAYPDRIAQQTNNNQFKLSNGRRANVRSNDPYSREQWLAVASLGGDSQQVHDNVYLATPLDPSLFNNALNSHIKISRRVNWDDASARFIGEKVYQCGELVVRSEALKDISESEQVATVLNYLKQNKLDALNWTQECKQLCARAELVRLYVLKQESSNNWPDFSLDFLNKHCDEWLAPYLSNVRSKNDLRKLDLLEILTSRLDWSLQTQLKNLAPTHIKVASGSRIKIDYTQAPPVLAVKLQEMFGCNDTPRVLDGQLALAVHLLSPAQRPLQITQDLAGFWLTSYQEVKKEMKGRYPKHPWPDDPTQATATRFTKNRMQKKS